MLQAFSVAVTSRSGSAGAGADAVVLLEVVLMHAHAFCDANISGCINDEGTPMVC